MQCKCYEGIIMTLQNNSMIIYHSLNNLKNKNLSTNADSSYLVVKKKRENMLYKQNKRLENGK